MHRRYTGNGQLVPPVVGGSIERNALIERDNFFHPRFQRPQ